MAWIDDVGYVEDEIPKPASYEEQVAYARQIGVPENEIASIVGTPESVAENAQIHAQTIYEATGQTPSWAQDVGYVPPPPAWLNPADYRSEGFAVPYTQEEITAQIDPSRFRTMNGQLYASVKGTGDLSGGEYLINPNTGRFALDASGNPIGVTYPAPSGFHDYITTPRGALTTGAAIMGALYGGTALLGAYGAGGAGAAAGAGALETAGAGGLAGGGAFIPAAGSGASFTIAPGAAYTAAGLGSVGQALPYTTAFDAANLYGQGLSQAAIEQNLAMTGIDQFLAADAAGLASQGLSDAAIAQNLSYGYSPAELAGTGIESMALSSGGTGIDNLLSSLGSALKTPLGQLGVKGGLGLLSGGAQQTPVPQMAGGSGTYAPKGQVDYTPILNLLAPKQIARNTNSLLG